LPAIGNVPQTQVTFVAKIDVKGSLPRIAMTKMIVDFCNNIGEVRKRLDRSRDLDCASRNILVGLMKKELGSNGPGALYSIISRGNLIAKEPQNVKLIR